MEESTQLVAESDATLYGLFVTEYKASDFVQIDSGNKQNITTDNIFINATSSQHLSIGGKF